MHQSLASCLAEPGAARIGAYHAYAFDADRVRLDAEIVTADARRAAAADWALELWACAEPWSGGALRGQRVAEVRTHALSTDPAAPAVVHGTVAATLPTGHGDHAMVLALFGIAADGSRSLADAVNFPRRECFALPRLTGAAAYRIDGERLELRVDGLENPRAADNLSGTLALELWALERPYAGGDFSGHCLGSAIVGRLAGHAAQTAVALETVYAAAPAGVWQPVLMLREWTADGYVTRDFVAFDAALQIAAAAAADAPAAAEAPAAPVATAPVTADADDRVSVNTASAPALAAIKGLPKALAAAIVAGRPYATLEDLLRVKGMGRKLLEKLRGHLGL